MNKGIPRKGSNKNIRGKLFFFYPKGFGGYAYVVRAEKEDEAREKLNNSRLKDDLRVSSPVELKFNENEVAEVGYISK